MAMKTFRLRRMEQFVLEHESVSMEELCREFDISMNTARLDVAELVEKGSIKKVYGGVTSNRESTLVPFEERKMQNEDGKRAACRLAASLVDDGDIIYIDSGTTTMYMIDFLRDKKNLTILTHNLNAIVRAVPYPNLTVFSLPGTLDRKTDSFVAADTGRTLERYNIKKAFLATAGISAEGDVTNSSPMEFEVKKAALANSFKKYVVTDSSKYRRTALLTYTSLSKIDAVIMDKYVDEEFVSYCKEHDVKLMLADPMEE